MICNHYDWFKDERIFCSSEATSKFISPVCNDTFCCEVHAARHRKWFPEDKEEKICGEAYRQTKVKNLFNLVDLFERRNISDLEFIKRIKEDLKLL